MLYMDKFFFAIFCTLLVNSYYIIAKNKIFLFFAFAVISINIMFLHSIYIYIYIYIYI